MIGFIHLKPIQNIALLVINCPAIPHIKQINMEISVLMEVKAEMKRFEKKLNDAMARIKQEGTLYSGTKETGAVKRAALDLKNELTRITK